MEGREESAFEELKRLSTDSINFLALLKFDHPYLLGADANEVGIGAVLRRNSLFEPTIVLLARLTTAKPFSRLAWWLILLSHNEFEIEYRPGRVYSNADGLSRFMTSNESEENDYPPYLHIIVIRLSETPFA